jgi:streptogrisin D
MTGTSQKNRLRSGVLTAATAGIAAIALATPAAAASSASQAGPAGADTSVRNAAVTSLQHDGMSTRGALDRLGNQASGTAALDKLTDSLGGSAVGAYLDSHGNPVVNVADQAAAAKVRAAGATARVVPRDKAELTAITQAFERAKTVPSTAWGIDPKADQVVLTLSDASPHTGAATLRAIAKRHPQAVRVRRISKPITEEVYDGGRITTGRIIFSAGFNVYSGSQPYVITAGHCTQGGPYWQGIGPSVGSSFGRGSDYGIIRNDSSSAPGVVDLHNGRGQRITSVGRAYAGEQVCKSGQTTGLTCGTVQGLNKTVHYADGTTVYGLIQTNVYSDHGDSGGPLFDG